MTGNRTSSRAGRAVAAAACALAMGVVAAPAADAAPVGASSGSSAAKATIKCGNPELKAWYDSDQFGTDLKVWFKTAKGCPKGRKVHRFFGEIHCLTNHKRVYRFNVGSKKAPYSSVIQALPPKKKCKKFWAKSSIFYTHAKTLEFKDTWRWNWGDYPA